MLKSSVLIILCCLISTFGAFSQTVDDTLIGIVDQQLIKINKNTGGINNFVPVSGIPAGSNTSRLTWCEPNQCFYTIAQVYPPVLAKIDLNGNFTTLGTLTFLGGTLFMCEGIGFNRFDGELYASASLNGDPNSSPADYYSETLVRIDTTSLSTTVVGTFPSTTQPQQEADALTFDDNGVVYYYDGQPGQFNRFFMQDIAFANPPVLISSSSYIPTRDLTVKGNDLFFSQERMLKKITIPTQVFSNVGTMFTAADFNGQYMAGITWRVGCTSYDLFTNDTTICSGQVLTLSPSVLGSSYLWQDGSTNLSYDASIGGIYWVEVTDAGCTYTDTIAVNIDSAPVVNLPNDTTLCFGQSLMLNTPITTGNHLWQDGSTGNTFTVNQSGTYWLSETNNCGTDTDTIIVDYYPEYSFDLGNDTTICFGNTVELMCDLTGATVVWQDGSTGPNFTATNTGMYSAQASLNGCLSEDNINVNVIEAPIVELGNDLLICSGDNALLTIQDETATFQWNTGSTESSIVVDSEGTYSVNLINICGATSDSIRVDVEECYCGFYVPNAFTPNSDEFNNLFGPVFDCIIHSYNMKIYNRWGEVIFESEDPYSMWDGTYLGKTVQDGVYSYVITYSSEFDIVETVVGHLTLVR